MKMTINIVNSYSNAWFILFVRNEKFNDAAIYWKFALPSIFLYINLNKFIFCIRRAFHHNIIHRKRKLFFSWTNFQVYLASSKMGFTLKYYRNRYVCRYMVEQSSVYVRHYIYECNHAIYKVNECHFKRQEGILYLNKKRRTYRRGLREPGNLIQQKKKIPQKNQTKNNCFNRKLLSGFYNTFCVLEMTTYLVHGIV